jgi:hypothetical protein
MVGDTSSYVGPIQRYQSVIASEAWRSLYSNEIAEHPLVPHAPLGTSAHRNDAQFPAIPSLLPNLGFCKYISIQKIWQDESACTLERIDKGYLWG